jgi:hypothetical protein
VFTLGITWMLDGLEVTLVGVVSGVLKREVRYTHLCQVFATDARTQDTLGLDDFLLGVSGTMSMAGTSYEGECCAS